METNTDATTLSDNGKYKYGDPWIWGIYVLLCISSIVETFSALSRELDTNIYAPILKHVVILGLGFVVLFVVQSVPYKKYLPWIAALVVITIISFVALRFMGNDTHGAKRALTVLGFSIQPSELAKLSTVLVVAWIMARYQEPGGVRTVGVVLSATIVVVFGAFTITEGLTNTVIFMCVSLAMMFVSGIQWKKFGIVLLVYGVLGGGFMLVDHIITEKRIEEAEAQGRNAENVEGIGRGKTHASRLEDFAWNEDTCILMHSVKDYSQEQYSYMARANGGFFGVMPGNSREASRLPLASSDFVYSIIVEETGFVGGIVVLILYLSLLARAGRIAPKCKRAFPAFLVLGMAVMITLQALSHISYNCGMMPVTGQPLPLISTGGSSIMVISVAFGVMLSVSKYAAQVDESGKIDRMDREGNVSSKALQAENPVQLDGSK